MYIQIKTLHNCRRSKIRICFYEELLFYNLTKLTINENLENRHLYYSHFINLFIIVNEITFGIGKYIQGWIYKKNDLR